MQEHEEQLTRIENAIQRIEHSLYTGNGSPPVLSRLAALESTDAASKKFVATAISIVGLLFAAVTILQRIVWP